jgi:hypothetical protein
VQIVIAQEDYEIDLMTLISSTQKITSLEVSPVRWRAERFSEEISFEYSRLQSEEILLRKELQYLAVDLSTGNTDVSICLDIALEDADKIFTNRSMHKYSCPFLTSL